METILCLKNDGQKIASTNFWETVGNHHGLFFLSTNAGALRLMVPDSQRHVVNEFHNVKHVRVTRGLHHEVPSEIGIELVFVDDSRAPYVLQMHASNLDRLFPKSEAGQDLPFTVWINGQNKKAKEVWTFRARLGWTDAQLPSAEITPKRSSSQEKQGGSRRISSFEHYALQAGKNNLSPRWQCDEAWLDSSRQILETACSENEIVRVAALGSEELFFSEMRFDTFTIATAFGVKPGISGIVSLATWVTNWDETNQGPAWQTVIEAKAATSEKLAAEPSLMRDFEALFTVPMQKPQSGLWCAVFVTPFIVKFPEIMQIVGNFQRAMTWAQLESAGYDISPNRDPD